jgi:hypothetical protein
MRRTCGDYMPETFEQYRQRILGNLNGQKAERVLASSGKRLEKLIRGVPPKKLAARPAPGKWCVNEILAHLADAEIAYSWRVRAIIGNPGCDIAAYDQDAWANSMNYAKRNAKQSLATYGAFRDSNVALLKSLRPEQRELYGIHSERGQESVELLSSMMAGHDLNHIRQIEGILRPAARSKKR